MTERKNKPVGPHVVWTFYGYEGWTFHDAETLEDALDKATSAHGLDWVITPPPIRLVASPDAPP